MADPEMDHNSDVELELDSAAIAAAMGFSSFGSQPHPNKRRRFNPLADAVVDTPRDSRPPAASAGPARPPTTSANSVPVRPTRAPMSLPAPSTLPPRPTASLPLHPPLPSAKANADEIEIDIDGDEDDDDGSGLGEAPGPQYIDTSRPIGEVRDHGLEGEVGSRRGEGEDDATFQARMHAVVAAGNAKYGIAGPAAAASGPDAHQLDGSVLSTGCLGRPHHDHAEGGRLKDRHGFRASLVPGGLAPGQQDSQALGSGDAVNGDTLPGAGGESNPDLDAAAARSPRLGTDTDGNAAGGSAGGDDGQQQQQPQGGHGQHNGRGQRDWWTGYYDPSSNENPWSRLEDKLELPPRSSSWLDRGHYKGQQGNNGSHRRRGGFQNRGRGGPRRY